MCSLFPSVLLSIAVIAILVGSVSSHSPLPQHGIFKRNARTHQRSPASISRIISFLEKKNINKQQNMDRALEEWRRLNRPSRSNPRSNSEENMKEVITSMMSKIHTDYAKQNLHTNPNATGNSVIFRTVLKFYVEATPKDQKFKIFEFFSDRMQASRTADLMSLDDAVIFGYIWIQEIIKSGLASPSPSNTAVTSNIVYKVSAQNDFLVRNAVRSANRLYPAGPENGQPLSVSDWWLRQRQHSSNVYKVYHFVKALVTACQENNIETATIYESMVDEYKKSGRELDTFELNMIDYLAYQMFGMIEHADPDRW